MSPVETVTVDWITSRIYSIRVGRSTYTGNIKEDVWRLYSALKARQINAVGETPFEDLVAALEKAMNDLGIADTRNYRKVPAAARDTA